MVRARIGDLAIVRFDPNDKDKLQGKQWDEKVGIVTGCWCPSEGLREYRFIYWDKIGDRTKTYTGTMPSCRLIRARPLMHTWNGALCDLTRNHVVPVSYNFQ